jgi:hypothetical protein
LDSGGGRVDLQGNTHRWLAAESAPGWTRTFGLRRIGWRCTDDFDKDNGRFTTTWMLDGLNAADVGARMFATARQQCGGPRQP